MLSHPPSIEDIFAHYTVIFDTLERTGTVAYSLNALATTPTFVFPKKVTSSELLSNYCCLFFASPSECVLCSLDFTQSIYVSLCLSLFISLTDWLTDWLYVIQCHWHNQLIHSSHHHPLIFLHISDDLYCIASQGSSYAIAAGAASTIIQTRNAGVWLLSTPYILFQVQTDKYKCASTFIYAVSV